jgi:hypothetical protein
MNSTAGGEPEQRFVMGLLLRDPGTLERLCCGNCGGSILFGCWRNKNRNFDNSLFISNFPGVRCRSFWGGAMSRQLSSSRNQPYNVQLLQRLKRIPGTGV